MKNSVKKYLKNSLVVKFFIRFIASLLVLYIAKHMVGIYPPYERNIKTYGLVIIGINIIFGLLILRKLDNLKTDNIKHIETIREGCISIIITRRES